MKLIELTWMAATGQGFKFLNFEIASHVDGDVCMISFGGSDDVRDWLIDADQQLTDWPGSCRGKVHWGFYTSALTLYRFVLRLVRGSGCKKVAFAGHSLGGAIAALLALAFHEDGYEVVAVESYGAPRIGDKEFCRCYPCPLTRYVLGRDKIPSLPWWGYADLGPPTRLRSPQTWWARLLPWRWLTDHLLFSYRTALEKEH